MRPLRKLRQLGFVLMEVLLAVAILAIGLTALLQAITAQARAAGLAGQYVHATLELDEMMSSLFMGPASLLLSETEGACSSEDQDYKCSLRMAETLSSPHPQVVFQRVEGQVKWPSGKNQRTLNASFFDSKVLEQ